MHARRFRTPGRRLLTTAVTAAAAAALPLTLTAPARAGAPSPHAAQHGSVGPMLPRVVQIGGPVDVTGGEPINAGTTFQATLPASTTGMVHAAVVFNGDDFGAGDTGPQHSAAHLHALCAIGDGPYQPCAWHGDTYDETDPYRGDVWLSLPPAPAGTSITYKVLIGSDYGLFLVDELLTGWVELTSDDGTPLADGPAQMQYRKAWSRRTCAARCTHGTPRVCCGGTRATTARSDRCRSSRACGWAAAGTRTPRSPR